MEEKLARELEISYFEWKLNSQIMVKEEALLAGLMETGYSYEVGDGRDRVKRYSQIVEAKQKHLREVQDQIARNNSPWLKSLVGNMRPGTERFADAEKYQKLSYAFLQKFFPEPNMVLLRWECLRDLLGKKATDEFLREKSNFQKWESAESEQSGKSKYDVIFVDMTAYVEPLESTLETQLKLSGFTIFHFIPSSFGNLEEQAQELRNLLTTREIEERNIILVSRNGGSAVVYSLLNQFSTLRMSERIRGWININGQLFGEPVTHSDFRNHMAYLRQLRNESRAPASVDPMNRRVNQDLLTTLQYRTEIQLTLGSGFPIHSVLSQRHIQNAGILHSALLDGKNYFTEERDIDKVVTQSIYSFAHD